MDKKSKSENLNNKSIMYYTQMERTLFIIIIITYKT
jgi:hypothetical protein